MKSVFGIAFDFIIYGVEKIQLSNIYKHQNLSMHVHIENIGPKISYLRNVDQPYLKNTKNILR